MKLDVKVKRNVTDLEICPLQLSRSNSGHWIGKASVAGVAITRSPCTVRRSCNAVREKRKHKLPEENSEDYGIFDFSFWHLFFAFVLTWSGAPTGLRLFHLSMA